jgi:cystathionine beta-lyase/cystathionine gamma-synthase
LAPSTSPQDGLLRLSVGLEDAEDLWDAPAHALAATRVRAAA